MDMYSDVYQVSSRESLGTVVKQKMSKVFMANKRLMTLNKMMSSKEKTPHPTAYPVNRFNSTIPPLLSPPMREDKVP